MIDLVVFIGLLYVLVALLIWFGLRSKQSVETDSAELTGSLVICARDEEKTLPGCLDSVAKQTVNPDRLEIILVDDASQDGTPELMEDFAGRSRYQVKVVHLYEPEKNEPAAKWRALKEGIKFAGNDAFLLTDADAMLPPEWAEMHLNELNNSDIVAGFALISGDSAWGRIQRLEWLFVLSTGSALAHWKMPQSALGKNMSIRRDAYERVGGLEKIGFSLTEDLSIVHAIVRSGGKISFPCKVDLSVSTPAATNWKEFMSQRQRWATGIKFLGFSGKAILALTALRNLAVVIGVIAGSLPVFWIWMATAASNFLIQHKVSENLKSPLRLKIFILWELFYTWTFPLQLIQILFKNKVIWKEKIYSSK